MMESKRYQVETIDISKVSPEIETLAEFESKDRAIVYARDIANEYADSEDSPVLFCITRVLDTQTNVIVAIVYADESTVISSIYKDASDE